MSEEMDTKSLLPCPFCGEKHDFSLCLDVHYGNQLNIVCKGKILFCAWDKITREKVAKHWNTRPIEDALRARIAELELRLDAYSGNLLDVLQAENARLLEEASWVEVKDRLPRESGTYLVYYLEDGAYGSMWYSSETWEDLWAGSRVTHWRPLPEPPNVTNDAETHDKV